MKRIIISLALAFAAQAYAQTNAPIDNFTLVTNLWWNGYKTNVLQIAERRLAANSNDLAGLVLKMEFNISSNNVECFSNDIQNVLSSLPSVNGTNFSKLSEVFLLDLNCSLDFLANEFHPTQDEILADKAKFIFNHKPLIYEKELKALSDDGLF